MNFTKLSIAVCAAIFSLSIAAAQKEVETRLISDMNLPGEWKVSKWSTTEGRIAVRPEAPEALAKENPPVTKSLGVKIDWPGGEGFRFLSLVPGSEPKIPFKVKELQLWVNGSNTEHFCEIILNDGNGKREKIGLGKLNFTGWRKLTKKLPGNIVQPITITGITIHDWGNPTPGETTVYLTHLQVVIDPKTVPGAEEKVSSATDTNDSW